MKECRFSVVLLTPASRCAHSTAVTARCHGTRRYRRQVIPSFFSYLVSHSDGRHEKKLARDARAVARMRRVIGRCLPCAGRFRFRIHSAVVLRNFLSSSCVTNGLVLGHCDVRHCLSHLFAALFKAQVNLRYRISVVIRRACGRTRHVTTRLCVVSPFYKQRTRALICALFFSHCRARREFSKYQNATLFSKVRAFFTWLVQAICGSIHGEEWGWDNTRHLTWHVQDRNEIAKFQRRRPKLVSAYAPALFIS
jgi:hypothetical protein